MLHGFQENNRDGYFPHAGPYVDKTGTVYGTTLYGGNYSCSTGNPTFPGCGTVYRIVPNP